MWGEGMAEILPVTIDGIEFDALMESTESYSASVPTYTVESGFAISDSIVLSPLSLNMTLVLTPMPVTHFDRHGYGVDRVKDSIERLKELYFTKEPVTIVTADRIYEDMAILTIELSKAQGVGAYREIPISFQQIRIVESAIVEIPSYLGRSGGTGVNAGTANTTSGSSEEGEGEKDRGTILHNASQWLSTAFS